MPKGIASQQTQAQTEAELKERQLMYALGSYERNRADAIQSLVAYKRATCPRERKRLLNDAKEAMSLADLARTVAGRHGRTLPALPAIQTARRAS